MIKAFRFLWNHWLAGLAVLIFVVLGIGVFMAAGASAPSAEAPVLTADLPGPLPGVSLTQGLTPDSDVSGDGAAFPFVSVLSSVISVGTGAAEIGVATRDVTAELTDDASSGSADRGSLTFPGAQAPRPNTALAGVRVLIDPGHGLTDSPGVSGPTGLEEAVIVLDISEKLGNLIANAGGLVSLTREGEFSELSNHERAEMANRLSVDVFIRVHAERYTSAAISGVEVLWQKDNSRVLAERVAAELSSATGFVNLGANQVSGYEALLEADVPTVQVSVGALSSRQNEDYLRSEPNREDVAEALYHGIVKYSHGR